MSHAEHPRADQPRAPKPRAARRRWAVRILIRALIVGFLVYAVSQPVPGASAQTAPTVPQQQEPASTNPGCGSLPVISEACNQLLDGAAWAINCGVNGVGDCTADVTENVVAGAFDYFARWVAVGAIGATDLVWVGINGTTTPDVNSSSAVFQTSMQAAKALALPLLILAGLYSLIKRDAEIVVKSALFYLPGSVIGMVLAGYIITALLAATDELGAAYMNDGQNGLATWLDQLGGNIAGGIGVTAPILLVIFSFILMAGSLLLWFVMLVRAAAILVTYAFMPLAFAALIFPATRSWIRRLFEVQLSFILSKPVILAFLSLGAATLNDDNNALVSMMQATALFFMAAFSPFALMKLLPFVHNEALTAMEAQARRPHGRVVATASGLFAAQRLGTFLAGSQQSPPSGGGGSGSAMPFSASTDAYGSGAGGETAAGSDMGGGDPSGPAGPDEPWGGGYNGSSSNAVPGAPGSNGGGAAPAADFPGGSSSGGELASGAATPPTAGEAGR